MELEDGITPDTTLRLVTDDMVAVDALRRDGQDIAIGRRLVASPALGITRVTICGPSGTYVIEAEGLTPPAPAAARTTALMRTLRSIRRAARWLDDRRGNGLG